MSLAVHRIKEKESGSSGGRAGATKVTGRMQVPLEVEDDLDWNAVARPRRQASSDL